MTLSLLLEAGSSGVKIVSGCRYRLTPSLSRAILVPAMDNRLLILYFVLGGAVVASITYFGSRGQGLIAAIVSMLPTVSLVTLVSIYHTGGAEPAISYFRGMLIVLPVWILYVVSQILLLPRLGLVPSLAIGITVYLVGVFAITRFVH